MRILLLPAAVALAALSPLSTVQAQTASGLVGSPDAPWAGPYVGAHGGYGWDSDSFVRTTGQQANNINNVTNLARPDTTPLDRQGYVGGAQIGYNVQRGSVVLGLEADASATDMNDKATYYSPVPFGAAPAGVRSDINSRYDYLGSVRARAGLANRNVLIYATGGYGYGEVRDRASFSSGTAQTVAFAGDHTYQPSGWVAGGGVEYAIPVGLFSRIGASRVTVRAEYLHYDLGDKTINVASTGGVGGYDARFDHQADVVRAGLNFKF